MTKIKLRNSATRKVEDFTPADPAKIGMYVCGPTVYDRAHLGNARPVVVADVLYRLLRHQYGADAVTYVRNITDIDDKINARAAESGRDIREITDETTQWYKDDMAALGTLPPDEQPRATDYVPQMIDMIGELIAKGAAYEAEGHVLFEVAKYESYGQLSGRSLDDMIAGARVEVAPYKRDPMDFVLWKPSDAATPGWDSPWGRGRPGWHIECSAMARELLGESFDIHMGGIDLQFPHHENEIAQSKCLCGEESFAKVWIHNEMLQVEGKKPMDWTESKRAEAVEVLKKWSDLRVQRNNPLVRQRYEVRPPHEDIVQALSNDLNTPLALVRLHQHAKEIGSQGQNLGEFYASLELLGIDLSLSAAAQKSFGKVLNWAQLVSEHPEQAAKLEKLVEERATSRSQKDFSRADEIRNLLASIGVKIDDGRADSEIELSDSFDPTKLEALQ